MLNEITNRLEELKERLFRVRKLEDRLKELSRQLAEAERNEVRLSVKLEQEQEDVDQLEGLSLSGLFYTLIGSKQDKLKLEKEEALRAKLQYDACKETVASIKQELEPIRTELGELSSIESEVARLTAEKERLMLENAHPHAERLNAILEERAEAGLVLKELKEAASAGRAVVQALQRASELLSSAKNWGTLDMLGGGLISTHVKHNRIDEARGAIHLAQRNMRQFQQELKDINQSLGVSIDVGSLLTFADYFFDGLISDWMVQGRLNSSLDSVHDALSKVRPVLSDVEGRVARQERRVAELKQEHAYLVETG